MFVLNNFFFVNVTLLKKLMYILDKDKTIFGFSKRNRTLKEKPEEKKKKVKKSESFLQRVWNKKSKNKKNKTEISLSKNNVVKKLDITDDVTIKTLGELQNILKKQNSVVKVRFHIVKKTLYNPINTNPRLISTIGPTNK